MTFPAVFNVTSLNGTNGFAFVDDFPDTWFGVTTINLGDINNDGKSDLIVGTASANQAYVLFGANRFPTRLYTSNLNGLNGFIVVGDTRSGILGCAIAGLGDINGDGIDDFSVGSCDVSEAFVIFGTLSFPPRFSVSSLNGRNGFKVVGYENQAFFGADGIGDVNGDGRQDFILGNFALAIDYNAAFVIYGNARFPSELNLLSLDGTNGFRVVASSITTRIASSVAGIGDFNGDNKPDFLIRLNIIDQNFVVFGADQFSAVMNTSNLNGRNGFAIIGTTQSTVKANAGYFSPDRHPVAGIGDINGDHLSDLCIGVDLYDSAFLVFGARHFNATFDVSSLNGSNGVKLIGPYWTNAFGLALSGTYSINDNGKSGVIIGAPQTGIDGATGTAYVFFGSDHFPPEFHVSSLNGTNGFAIVGQFHAGLSDGIASIDNFAAGKSAIVIAGLIENIDYIIFPSMI